jgi:hypothetical protein
MNSIQHNSSQAKRLKFLTNSLLKTILEKGAEFKAILKMLLDKNSASDMDGKKRVTSTLFIPHPLFSLHVAPSSFLADT